MTEKENTLVHWAISGEIQGGVPVAPNLPLLADKYYRVKVYEKLKIGLLAVLSAVLVGFHEFALPAKIDLLFNLCGILGLIGACKKKLTTLLLLLFKLNYSAPLFVVNLLEGAKNQCENQLPAY